MKLTDSEIRKVKARLGADPIPDDHPAMAQLTENYGEHTFYADKAGLGVFLLRAREDVPPDWATFVIIAEWDDESRSSLTGIDPPKVTTTSLNLAGAGTGG